MYLYVTTTPPIKYSEENNLFEIYKIVIVLDDASLSTVAGRVASQATSKICRYIIVMVIQIHESRESVIATILILAEVWSLVDAVATTMLIRSQDETGSNKSSTLLHAIKRDNDEEVMKTGNT